MDVCEKCTPVTIRLSYEQIEGKGKYKKLLSETQKEKLDKIKDLKKGLVLELDYEQPKINYTGLFLLILFAVISAIGAAAGGASAISNAVINAKHQTAEEGEMKRHNKETEKNS